MGCFFLTTLILDVRTLDFVKKRSIRCFSPP